MKKEHCNGCENDFYNDKNSYGVKECWHFKNAKIIKRKKVHIDQVPPYKQKPRNYPICYKKKGYVLINCDKEDRQY